MTLKEVSSTSSSFTAILNTSSSNEETMNNNVTKDSSVFNFIEFGKEEVYTGPVNYELKNYTYSEIFESESTFTEVSSLSNRSSEIEAKTNQTRGFWGEFCGPSVLPLNNMVIDNEFKNTERTIRNKNLIIYSTNNGILQMP